MMVDERVRVDVGRVAFHRVFEVGTVKRALELGHMALEPGFLGGRDLVRLRFNIEKLIALAGAERFVAGLIAESSPEGKALLAHPAAVRSPAWTAFNADTLARVGIPELAILPHFAGLRRRRRLVAAQ